MCVRSAVEEAYILLHSKVDYPEGLAFVAGIDFTGLRLPRDGEALAWQKIIECGFNHNVAVRTLSIQYILLFLGRILFFSSFSSEPPGPEPARVMRTASSQLHTTDTYRHNRAPRRVEWGHWSILVVDCKPQE